MGFRVRRVTTTRRGGVSRAPFDSFNLGDHVGDDPDAVAANRSRLAGALGVPDDHLIWMQQVHGDHVHRVEGPGTSVIPETDALVTSEPGIALAVLTADCVPVLFADAAAGVVAGAHAGRVGAKLGIVPRTIEAMVAAGAQVERISAFLGPAVSGRHYEVPAEMAADVEQALPGSRTTTSTGTPGLDLRAGIARQLSGLGVTAIDIDPRCTVEDTDLFSYRREPRTGRLASVIWLS
ncbi:peptidoglycan editing factor PgeF [Mycobacteroides saopaulense]|uniref:Purine nucleoside phosphorylase n=1 Tax=Mycobacteroides saopaulense TaxID=1578165 RepID=A0ABX3BX97_9MYCO|nr:peptidoglycan editing factor PgeF [Mycobacteroides saopaulense]OHT86553.1 laccase [Mycobacteroides saopaulense]OHU08412.1 laccase [Mycobacteroides saopaulense]